MRLKAMPRILPVLGAIACAHYAQPAAFYRDQGRSMVISTQGIVATSQTLASTAGASVLDHGGDAVDAAIAANAALGVIEPMMNGMGGDLFSIIYEAKTGKLYGLNASGWAPAATSISVLEAKGITGKIPGTSIHAVTVPGAVAGWDAMHKRFGRLPLSDDLAPAAYMAKNGVPITEIVANIWSGAESVFKQQAGFAHTFLPNGHAPKTGEVFHNPELARSLEEVGREGRDAFYRGRIGQSILKLSETEGGTMSAADLAEFQPEWVNPISTTYNGWRVYELPPNGQGIAALEMLNLMERFPMHDYGHNSADALHVEIEAKKLAYADLIRYIGDPRFSAIPVKQLLSKELAAERAEKIDKQHAHCDVLPSQLTKYLSSLGKDTTYLSVIDKDGNIVSLIQSNFAGFGTGLVAPETGFALQNRGALFTLAPNQPNSLEPRKRSLHTIIPAFMEKGDVKIGFGIMGGFNQAQAHAQFVANIVDFGMNVQKALEASRFTKPTFAGCDVELESGISSSVQQQLAARGHQIKDVGTYSEDMGRGNVVMLDGKGVKYGGSDPRGDGEAVPQAAPWFAGNSQRR
jgi:gamma-glutamyltranspeptidase/glutathione hydrolase